MAKQTQLAFFSYSRQDSGFALKLAEELRAAGAAVWLDQLDIGPAQRWDRAVQDALEKCPQMLIVLSPSAVESDNVMDEVSFALEKRKPVIPVLYRDCEIPFRLRRLQYIDVRTEYQKGLRTLLKMLGVAEPPEKVTRSVRLQTDPSPAKRVSLNPFERRKVMELAGGASRPEQPPEAASKSDSPHRRRVNARAVLGRTLLVVLSSAILYLVLKPALHSPNQLLDGWFQRSGSPTRTAAREASPIPLASQSVVRPTPGGFKSEQSQATSTVDTQPSDSVLQHPTAPRARQIKLNPRDGQRYVWIPPGKFVMGCDACGDGAKPAHSVTIKKGFWMGETEVTAAAYQRIMATKPSSVKDAAHYPVQVTWKEARRFCQEVGMRLPTEAEWEHAALPDGFVCSEDNCPHRMVAGWSNEPVRVREGGQNARGLYDMLGELNMMEWMSDWYSDYTVAGQVDPRGPPEGKEHVRRGAFGFVVWDRSSGNEEAAIGVRCVGN